MTPDKQRIQRYLKAFDFKPLFVDELGWDYLKEPPLIVCSKEQSYTLRPLVEKRGVKVYVCDPDAQGCVPDDTRMRQIDREVTKYAYEHIVIYVDAAKENQAWLWVKREQGKPLAPRVNKIHKGQSGDLLAQKLISIAFEFAEEERLTTHAVAGRVRQAFDVERVTKKFYDRFKAEHSKFLSFIQGITSKGDREWYTSLMLNRLMFAYFIQRQGFLDTNSTETLDGDAHYLRHRLERMQAEYSRDSFYSFYRYFLLKLFHDGLSRREHTPELEKLLGKIPYLNGGLFDIHQLERDYPDIQIPDEAFKAIFDFFDEYDWHLDDRPTKSGNEINPDVLGYIFEKYINQKQMGAYYTKEDITEYISKNTIIPYLFEAAEQKCLIAFAANGPVWSLLCENPDRYIYAAVKKGADLLLPPEIEVGIHDVSQRTEWNKSAPPEYALPTEIWREVVARRTRYEELRAKLAAGEVSSINDLITYNLDIRQFAQDVLTYSEGPELLLAFYESIEQIAVLDPTCGSGAFLFASLTILEPLYEACLDRMKMLVEERDSLDQFLGPSRRRKFPRIERFRAILQQVEKHSSRDYFILKSIIINNLYGVDIMEEATEICKLRLFLKLAAQVKKFKDIEPLPDIDFNVRAGNTLVGFASYDEVKESIARKEQGKGARRGEVAFQSKMDFDDTMGRVEQRAKEVERGFKDFRAMQTEFDLAHWDLAESKQQLLTKLDALNADLDEYLAAEYGIDRLSFKKKEDYDERFKQWQQTHQPFHWFVQFYGIMNRGGFDVVIGNPPYAEYDDKKFPYILRNFVTRSCANLYTCVVERSHHLLAVQGYHGMILPLSAFSTRNMIP
ncbi:MAG TPA: DNA methyltransferase, partial [Ktedonobacteraceae bacterium]|nr:DNA methyltransferase [Ktedonobacteraceae bacterium]